MLDWHSSQICYPLETKLLLLLLPSILNHCVAVWCGEVQRRGWGEETAIFQRLATASLNLHRKLKQALHSLLN